MPALLGQQLFPSDNAWNQNISNAPVAGNSAAIISHIGGGVQVHADWGEASAANGNAPLYGIPFNVVHGNTTPRIHVIIDNYPGESDLIDVPIPAGAVVEGDYQNGPNPNGGGYDTGQRGDSHLLVWDVDNNVAYELYGVTRPSDPSLFPDRNGDELPHTDGMWHAAGEAVWDMKANTFRTLGWTSADAAGLSILTGLVRPDEALPVSQGGQGAISHALRFTLPNSVIDGFYTYPASHVANSNNSTSDLPYGGRLRLKNNTQVNNLIATMGPQAQIVAKAMQQYGMILADGGSAMYVSGASFAVNANNQSNLVWDMDDALGIQSLTASMFDVVDLTPKVTGLSASSGTAGSVVTITGQNFSGAAGRLSVLFGSTASTSVTYVDDAHLTAVVPSGTGTVHVTVQSGVNAPDTDNIKNPIFGYGVSATSTADQFTFGGATISGTSSTATLGASTVPSGSGDVVTILVKDTAGNPVGGLASGAFTLSLSGGTSAGTFGAVSGTGTAGTYTATFTGTTAGTASGLTVAVAGVSLTAHPTVQVTPGPVSGSNSTVSLATPTVASGGTDVLTIVVKDAAGNTITGLADTAFALGLLGGTSGGTFGAVTETATPGTYTATFTASAAGSPSTLHVTVSGIGLASHPALQATPGSISGSNSTVSFAAYTVPSGSPDVVTIVAKDTAGNPVSGLTSGAFALSLSDGTSTGSFGTVSETGTPGTYTAVFTGVVAGAAGTLTATIGGVPISAHPTVQVTAGPVSLSQSTLSAAPGSIPAGQAVTITLTARDSTGNQGPGGLTVVFGLAPGSAGGTLGAITANGNGTYTATFTATASGTDTFTAAIGGQAVTSASPVVTVTAPPVVPPPPPPPPTPVVGQPIAVGGSPAGAVLFVPDGSGRYNPTPVAVFNPFAGLGVDVRTATGDVNGDGFTDTILVTGPGTPGRFAVVSGRDNTSLLIAPTDPYGDVGGFAAGGFVVSGDLNGDGRAEIVITPDIKGGPRVIVARLETDGTVSFPYSFIGIQDEAFRDGARAALGDFNTDGAIDIAVIAALNGGPRTAIFDGRTIAAGVPGAPPKLIGDFFATASAQDEGRGGRYISAGDVNGDGFADLIVTGDPTIGGGAQVTIFSGADLAAGKVVGTTLLADFGVSGITAGGGVRVATTTADGDARADLIVASGNGQPSLVKVYPGATIATGIEPPAYSLDPFNSGVLTDGVFVG